MIFNKFTTNTMERKLVGQILAGNEQALRSFYTAYKGKIFSFVSFKIDNQKDAEEVFSDIFLSGIESLRDFAFSSSLSTYLFEIAKHKIVDYYRRKKVEVVLFSKLGDAVVLVSHLLTPEQEYAQNEAKHIIELTLRNLLPRYEKILRLKYLEGLSVKEISQQLSETVKQTEAVLFRARKAFIIVYKQWDTQQSNHLKRKLSRNSAKRWVSNPVLSLKNWGY